MSGTDKRTDPLSALVVAHIVGISQSECKMTQRHRPFGTRDVLVSLTTLPLPGSLPGHNRKYIVRPCELLLIELM